MAANEGPWWSKDTVAVVTGANRGIGYEIVRQLAQRGLTVVLTARDQEKGEAAIQALQAESLDSVVFHPLDLSNSESLGKLAAWLKEKYGGIDILINNAALNASKQSSYDIAKQIIDTNYYGTKKVTKGLLPLLRASPNGARIVNLTSRQGLYERLAGESLKEKLRDENSYTEELADSLAAKYLEDVKKGQEFAEGWIASDKSPMYSESKIFLNIFTSVFSKSLLKPKPEDQEIFVTSYCPGVTGTDMFSIAVEAGFEVPEGLYVKTVAEGADTGVWLALLPKEELLAKHGRFFGERNEFPLSMHVPF